MLDRVIHTIKSKNMIKAGDKVICALSGGADSMALLSTLFKAREELGINLYAAHLNHGIRGLEADGDEAFVKEYCEKLNITLFCKRVDIPNLSKERGVSEEECGRDERYAFFDSIAEKLGGSVIATGHHANDNAETVLFNLFRGSGALKGIPHVRGNIVRPLLNVQKSEIVSFLIENNIPWREDSTNKEDKYARNNIRNIIMKDICQAFPNAMAKINECESICRIDEDYLNSVAMESGAFSDGHILVEKFSKLHESIKRRVIILALKNWGCENITGEKIQAVYKTIEGQSGNGRDLGGGLRVCKSYEIVFVNRNEKNCEEKINHLLKMDENVEISAFDGVWKVKTVDKTQKMRDNKMMIILDADKIGGEVFLRTRRDGDYMYPKGLNGRKKVKEIFIDLKIPREKREEISLLSLNEEVLFIPGIKKTGNYLPDENTTKFFVAEFKPCRA